MANWRLIGGLGLTLSVRTYIRMSVLHLRWDPTTLPHISSSVGRGGTARSGGIEILLVEGSEPLEGAPQRSASQGRVVMGTREEGREEVVESQTQDRQRSTQ